MHVYLPAPYPDELIFSVFARHTRNTGTPTANLIRAAFGSYKHVGVGICGNLEQLAAATTRTWGLSAEEILIKNSNFPVYSAYMSREAADKVKCRILLGDMGSAATMMGINSAAIVRNRHLRICPECCREDVAVYGETYWHREHQLDGILVCSKHGLWLQQTDCCSRVPPRSSHPDATVAWESGTFAEICEFPGSPVYRHAEIAASLLRSADNCKSSLREKDYEERLLRKGFITNSFKLDRPKVEEVLQARLGVRLVGEIGIAGLTTGNQGFTARLISRPDANLHYIYHIVLQELISHLPEVAPPCVGYGPWKCPNPYCNQPEPRHIAKATLGGVRAGPSARGECNCGFKFTFRSSDGQIPKVHSIWRYGRTWAVPAKELRTSGCSLNEISKRLGISIDTTRELLNRDQLPPLRHPERIQEMKKQWIALRDSVPGRSITKAKSMNQALHAKLRRADPEWLAQECSTDRAPRVNGKRPIDYQARDYILAAQIEEAAKNLKALNPGRRLTAAGILRRAGLPSNASRKTFSSDKYPASRDSLDRHVESKLDHWTQKLGAAVNELGGSGASVKRSIVLRAAGINFKALNLHGREQVERLLKEILEAQKLET